MRDLGADVVSVAEPRLVLTCASEWNGTSDGRRYRREEWSLIGGDIDPAWRKGQADDWKPWCRFTLYIVNANLDRRLSSYGGSAWPTAWPELFEAKRQGTYAASVDITDKGLALRAATLATQGDSHV